MDEKVKALANGILEQCQKQGLTYHQVWLLLTSLQARCNDVVSRLHKQVENETATGIKRF